MALIGTAALLVLGFMISPVYTQNLTTQCGDNYSSAISSTNFSLTVSSQNLTANSNYTVTVNGLNDTKTVILRAQSNNSTVGTWQNATNVATCILGIAFNATNTTNTANWTAPSSVNSSVILSVYILNGTGAITSVANATIIYGKLMKNNVCCIICS
ncbi:placenta-expressed transcript 1 protein-like [Pelobates fuscus]|uniref:placenta-expressed transcript 1 protein-like n=1 Tax=Pelobates fuscus TaxID=191477 RepID=UPI002FE47826